MPRIPLIQDLIGGPVPPGSNFLVEYDATSQWYNACTTIAAGWLRTDGIVAYDVTVESPADLRTKLK